MNVVTFWPEQKFNLRFCDARWRMTRTAERPLQPSVFRDVSVNLLSSSLFWHFKLSMIFPNDSGVPLNALAQIATSFFLIVQIIHSLTWKMPYGVLAFPIIDHLKNFPFVWHQHYLSHLYTLCIPIISLLLGDHSYLNSCKFTMIDNFVSLSSVHYYFVTQYPNDKIHKTNKNS